MVVDRNGIRLKMYDGLPESMDKILAEQCDFIVCRISPFECKGAKWLREHDFFFADCQLDCRVSLRRLPESVSRKRFEIRTNELSRQSACDIFHAAFVQDRRFHLQPAYNQELANCMMDSYVEEAVREKMALLSCHGKNQLLGCAFLQAADREMYVYMAAVLPQYQGTGASVELYRACAEYAAKQGKRILTGRISAANTSVLNLYADLGATFCNPAHVYILERKG